MVTYKSSIEYLHLMVYLFARKHAQSTIMKINSKQLLGFISTIMALMFTLPSYTIGQPPPCLTNNLVNNQVAQCACAEQYTEKNCHQCVDPQCTTAPLSAHLNSCNGCTNDDITCGTACSLYFTGLCHCLKGIGHGCQNNGKWWLLNSHFIITSQDKIAGILQLGFDNGGWAFGQSLLKGGVSQNGKNIQRDTGTLSVNSVTVRDQDQIHIHVCYNQNSGLRNYLTSLNKGDYVNLKRISMAFTGFPSDTILCQASQSQGASDINVASITANYVNGRTQCYKDDIGAGLITDKNDYSWVCLTTTRSASAEQLLCST